MSIENMSNNVINSSIISPRNNNVKKSEQKTSEKSKSENLELAAVYEKSSNSKSSKMVEPNRSEMKSLISQAERQAKNFQTLISSIFTKQSNKASLLKKAQNNDLKGFFSNLNVDRETVLKAKRDISEDGYYGVKKTSERILNFAKAAAGNNPKELERMRDAVEKGFKQVEQMWGGELPDISKQTYDVVMSKFDEWQQEANI